jgi:hypothetical protein
MRSRVCSLQLLLDLSSTVFLGSEYRWTHDLVSLPQIWDSPNQCIWKINEIHMFLPLAPSVDIKPNMQDLTL